MSGKLGLDGRASALRRVRTVRVRMVPVRARPEIYLGFNREQPGAAILTAGSQPDWQPLASDAVRPAG